MFGLIWRMFGYETPTETETSESSKDWEIVDNEKVQHITHVDDIPITTNIPPPPPLPETPLYLTAQTQDTHQLSQKEYFQSKVHKKRKNRRKRNRKNKKGKNKKYRHK